MPIRLEVDLAVLADPERQQLARVGAAIGVLSELCPRLEQPSEEAVRRRRPVGFRADPVVVAAQLPAPGEVLATGR